MITIYRVLRPIAPFAVVLAMAVGFNSVSAEACKSKNCAHHAKGKECSCPCGEDHAKADSKSPAAADAKKAHACSKESCKEAKCTDKGCCQHQGHDHDAS